MNTDNKLIAEFMGLKQVQWPDLFGNINPSWVKKEFIEDFSDMDDYSEESRFDWGNALPQTEDLYYHQSWDWLMPVVKKAWELTKEFQYDDEQYLHITEEIFHPDYSLSEFMDGDITSIYNRVVEFIKWYNQQKL